MNNPTTAEIAQTYTRRAFSVLRVAAGLSRSADRAVAALGRDLMALLMADDVAQMGRRDLAALLRRADEVIAAAFATLAGAQLEAARELLEIEGAWAARTLGASAPTDAALTRMLRDMLALGAPAGEQWERLRATMSRRIADAVRDAAANGTPLRPALADAIAQTRRDAQSVSDAVSTSAAAQGRAEVARSEGAVGWRWHAILDARVTSGCAMRHGLLYTLDYQPMGHTIPIERPPPRHWGCRSILLPLLRMPRATDRPTGSFEEFVASLSTDEQEELLGKGRAELWRRGQITKADLVNQRGRELTLRQLRGM